LTVDPAIRRGFDERPGNLLVRGDPTAINQLQKDGNSAFAG